MSLVTLARSVGSSLAGRTSSRVDELRPWPTGLGFQPSLSPILLYLALPLAQPFKPTMVNKDKNKNDHGEEKPTMNQNRRSPCGATPIERR
ncbi:hypothetical protein U1Q18_026286 [Sarracenia purpurea var. burkii]